MKEHLATMMAAPLMLVAFGGCLPGFGEEAVDALTVPVDVDGDRVAEAVAWDRDRDGQPDRDSDGQLEFVPGSAAGAAADTWGPAVLGLLGLVGVPGAAVAAAVWQRGRWGRRLADVVATVQQGRKALRDEVSPSSLAALDEALCRQSADTQRAVKRIKDKDAHK